MMTNGSPTAPRSRTSRRNRPQTTRAHSRSATRWSLQCRSPLGACKRSIPRRLHAARRRPRRVGDLASPRDPRPTSAWGWCRHYPRCPRCRPRPRRRVPRRLQPARVRRRVVRLADPRRDRLQGSRRASIARARLRAARRPCFLPGSVRRRAGPTHRARRTLRHCRSRRG
jgi:hypothetical protein